MQQWGQQSLLAEAVDDGQAPVSPERARRDLDADRSLAALVLVLVDHGHHAPDGLLVLTEGDDVLDAILEAYVEGDQGVADIVARGFDATTVKRVIAMVDRNEYKRRQGPIGIKITPRAFGKDWRLPIVNRFQE